MVIARRPNHSFGKVMPCEQAAPYVRWAFGGEPQYVPSFKS